MKWNYKIRVEENRERGVPMEKEKSSPAYHVGIEPIRARSRPRECERDDTIHRRRQSERDNATDGGSLAHREDRVIQNGERAQH